MSLADWLNRLPWRRRKRATRYSWGEALRRQGIPPARWLERRLAEGRLYVDLSPQAVALLAELEPRAMEETLQAADRILAHRFDLLGSGPFQPRDPRRPPRPDGYQPLDWHLDPKAGKRFPHDVPYEQWDPASMTPPGADIKLPWELARCQHWITLGQAWRLSGRVEFAREIARQLEDFTEANPLGLGINWACTMDVALRAANWALALELIRTCPALEQDFWLLAYEQLYRHGRFIADNLEDHYEVTSNHFLSDVVGLFYLAAVFGDLEEGRRWEEDCRAWLEREMETQVLPDGADFESSVPYHRLVCELFLGAARLAQWRGRPLAGGYHRRLQDMMEFFLAVLRPDGLMPQVGDADDGRLHIFSQYGSWRPQDGRHLLAPAGLMLARREWLRHAGPWGRWEAVWWGFSPHEATCGEEPPPPTCRLFPRAGLAVARVAEGHYLLVSNGPVGTAGFGNHKHNDQLSFEYHYRGRAVVVDPGSYVYTPDPDARNRFRGTAWHNTVMVDGEEQNRLEPQWLFRLFECARPRHLRFLAGSDKVVYWGLHRGYQRLANPVLHLRGLWLLLPTGVLMVVDCLQGKGQHRLRWHFHLAPGVEVWPEPGGYGLAVGGEELVLRVPEGLTGRIEDAWYSPSYGVRLPCRSLELSQQIRLEGVRRWCFLLGREADLPSSTWVRSLLEEFRLASDFPLGEAP